jgi:predicted membrane-bound spermidine synthase
METYNQPTPKPTAKIAAVGYAGAITTIIPLVVIVLNSLGATGLDPDALSTGVINTVAAIVTIYNAVSALITFAAGYFKREVK